MGKWLAICGAAMIVVLFVLWKQLDAPSATAATPPIKANVATASAPIVTSAIVSPQAVPAPIAGEAPKKIDVESDEFVFKFQDVVPAVLSRQAALCYDGIAKRVSRNQKMTLTFNIKIKDGDVTVNDVKVKSNTLANPGLETCFVQAVQRTTWHDDSLPDWESPDTLVLSPERGMKKYMQDNINYVGAEAPKDGSYAVAPH